MRLSLTNLSGQDQLKETLNNSNQALNENLVAVGKVELYMYSIASIKDSFRALGDFLVKLKKCDA